MVRRTDRPEKDFRDEIESHLALEADQLIEEGVAPDRAQRAARRAFGNVFHAEERFYESNRFLWLDHGARAARYALRQMRATPIQAAVIILSLALGIGLTTATFSVADQVLVRALPVQAPDQLVHLHWNGDFISAGMGSVGFGSLIPFPLYRALQEETETLGALFARSTAEVHLTLGDRPEAVIAELVTGTYFADLGLGPALGRLLGPEDDQTPNAHPVVVLSYDVWQGRLGGDPDVIGRQVRVNGHPMTVVGVAPQGFHGMDWSLAPAIWVPMMMKERATPGWSGLEDRRARFAQVYARPARGLDREQAQARLAPWFANYLQADTEREGWPAVTESQLAAYFASKLELLPGGQGQSRLGTLVRQPMLILVAAAALVLLLACLNVANLALARALAGRRATALRSALGASRHRIVAEQLVESTLFAAIGCAIGAGLAPLVGRAIIGFFPRDGAGDIALSPVLDARMLVTAMVVATLTTLLAGALPAFFAASVRPVTALRGQAGGIVGGLGLRKALVVGQFALALVLLVAAGLFARTLGSLRAQGPGFATERLMAFQVMPTSDGYSFESSRAVVKRLAAALDTLPEVERAGVAAWGLLRGGGWNNPVTVAADERIVTDRSIPMNAVSPDFFTTLGAPVVRGRDFDDRDAAEEAWNLRSAIVNEAFVSRYLADTDPIGARIAFGRRPDAQPSIEIVGVVRTFQSFGLREVEPQIYFSLWERSVSQATFYVRTRVDAAAAGEALRAAVRDIDAALTVRGLRTVDDHLDRALATERLLATLAGIFATLATVLALIGLYGVLAFSAELRTREVGLRLALGAPRWRAGGLIVTEAVKLVAIGATIALPAAWGLGRLIEHQLYGVRATDAATLVGAFLVLALVCVAASAVPVRRMVAVDPLITLRDE